MGPYHGTYLEIRCVHHVVISDNRKLQLRWASEQHIDALHSKHSTKKKKSHHGIIGDE